MRTAIGISRAFATALALVAASTAFAADDGAWSVKKSSGEVWMGSASGLQQASVKSDEVLKPGDTIRTGRNGRVLLVRGEESILIAPNSVVGLPAEKKEGLSTTIKQQAGSILLEVEKKNVRHFEVETPYLAAVVKGTQFRVTVNASGAKVDVVRGQVQVADFKTGQIAQVMPGQHATALSHGNGGLSLGGTGALQPIERGTPRASTIERVPVPRNGLSAPGKPTSASLQPRQSAGGPRHSATRISSALGEVRLNVHRATHGLARNAGTVPGARSVASRGETTTVWSTGEAGAGSGNNGNGNGGNSGSSAGGNGGGNGNGNGGGNGNSSAASAVAAVVGSGTGNGNGNGNNGNNGNHGNGNNGNGNGNNGNGNGNNGNGNGRGHR